MARDSKPAKSANERGLSSREQKKVEEQSDVSSPVLYQTVRAEGKEELERPATSLWWSGLAAGIGISASVFVQGYLAGFLPHAPWAVAVSKLGYCSGFLIVVLGRMQLFTENTLTAVLPLLVERTGRALLSTLRMWGIVLAANLAGTALAAVMAVHARLATPAQLQTFYAVARPLVAKLPLDVLMQAIPAGFFMAAMVWMLSGAKTGHFWIVTLMAYIIALGGFPHVVVGSCETFVLMFAGQEPVAAGLAGVLLPAFAGNVIGGTALFALLAYGQVKEEI